MDPATPVRKGVEQVKEQGKKRLRQYGRLMGTLCAITACAALLLGVVNALTASPIARRAEEKRRDAMTAVCPGGERFSQVPFDRADAAGMQAVYQGEVLMGYCVEVSADGFGGPIRLLVGVSGEGRVTGVSILSHRETAGLGSNADSPEFLNRFIGKTDGGRVDAISGATVTSRAVAQGVNAALDAVAKYEQRGGAAGEANDADQADQAGEAGEADRASEADGAGEAG